MSGDEVPQDKRHKPEAASAPLLGDLLIVGAQVLQASQFIIEEKFLAKVRHPLSSHLFCQGLQQQE